MGALADRLGAPQSQVSAMPVFAHIGNIPVEEWLPFVVPVVALYIYGRRKERRRREAVARLPERGEQLDHDTVGRVVAKWSAEKHSGVSAEHLPLLYPPGPDGMTAAELADRVHSDPATIKRLLEQLEELEYLDLGQPDGFDSPSVSLTFKGYELVDATEAALLAALQREVPAGQSAS
jgi:DNA-binding MarR family transcriptional regulator